MKSGTARVYPSRIDGLIGFSLLGVPLALLIALARQDLVLAPAIRAVALPLLLMLGALLVWSLFTTRYVIDEATLLVQCGPVRWRIPISEIESVRPSADMRSGPALSMDRLRICYSGGRSILVSPLRKEAFVQDLESRRRPLAPGRSHGPAQAPGDARPRVPN